MVYFTLLKEKDEGSDLAINIYLYIGDNDDQFYLREKQIPN